MTETTPRNQRIYVKLTDVGGGMMRVAASLKPPPYDGPMMVLLSRGNLPLGQPLSFLLVSDPSQDEALRGLPGKAATVKVGSVSFGPVGSSPAISNSGTDAAAVFDFTIPKAKDGADGLSAYQIARNGGYGGTETQWIASLTGASGKSAYQLARDGGYGGTETQWLASLKAADGVSPVLSIGTVTSLAAGSAATATLTGTAASPKLNIGVPRGDTGLSGATLLGTVTLSETAQLISINAGTRRVTITTPAAWGILPGQNLLLFPVGVPNPSYATHDVIATAANTLSIGLTTPAIALLASYSISARLVRINT
jgi:hypothetical protein